MSVCICIFCYDCIQTKILNFFNTMASIIQKMQAQTNETQLSVAELIIGKNYHILKFKSIDVNSGERLRLG